jgi:NADPH-dependent 2,4-dienoyl-CoA reductase/sulfur reductase-like enzyme
MGEPAEFADNARQRGADDVLVERVVRRVTGLVSLGNSPPWRRIYEV